jgi:hypothetical protein
MRERAGAHHLLPFFFGAGFFESAGVGGAGEGAGAPSGVIGLAAGAAGAGNAGLGVGASAAFSPPRRGESMSGGSGVGACERISKPVYLNGG